MEATDIPLTVPLSATEKGTLCYRKPSMTVEAARPQSWGVARLSFGMPKNVGQAVRKGNEIAKLYADDKVDVIIYAVEKVVGQLQIQSVAL